MNRFKALPIWAQIPVALIALSVIGTGAYYLGYNVGYLLGAG
ncbi:MAG: hypothetical protein AAF687_07980 [Pseudomonadota bacterium]